MSVEQKKGEETHGLFGLHGYQPAAAFLTRIYTNPSRHQTQLPSAAPPNTTETSETSVRTMCQMYFTVYTRCGCVFPNDAVQPCERQVRAGANGLTGRLGGVCLLENIRMDLQQHCLTCYINTQREKAIVAQKLADDKAAAEKKQKKDGPDDKATN
ncbi:hypothetical protein FH972_023169 [Carpinus fangiana]|uniref:Uncharacterized protein n=1 Tax=Carpinus fangiana TaxID=176857 RepID=A0A5N6KUR8_9ROSI|nr:hypothetical protein FH972_023169 [Carpinus fangiana]